MKKLKLFSVLAVLVLVMSIVAPFGGIRVHALGDFEENGIVYELQENDTYAVIECNSDAEEITIPSEANGKRITKIKSFSGFTGRKVELPEGLEIIGEKAFLGCKLRILEIPKTVKEIGKSAFATNASLEKVVLPENLEVIQKDTFANCYRLRAVELPKALKLIDESAFSKCYLLETINLPDKIENIDKSSFIYCHLLKNIAVSAGNNNFKVLEDGSLFDNNKNEVIVHVDKNDLAQKEKMADIVYNKLKELIHSDMSLESLSRNIDAFMQAKGGGKPEILNKGAFDNAVLENRRKILYRGIRGKCHFESLKNAEEAYLSTGFNGNGIYTTVYKSHADSYAFGAKDFVVAHMYLKDDAKVISMVDIDTIRHIIISKHYDEFPESEFFVFGDLPNNVNREIILNRGLMASILGFDALDCPGKGGEFDDIGDETVVVNRSKLVVCDEAVLA